MRDRPLGDLRRDLRERLLDLRLVAETLSVPDTATPEELQAIAGEALGAASRLHLAALTLRHALLAAQERKARRRRTP